MNRRQCLPSSCFLFLVWQIVLLFVLILLGNPDLGERWAINILNTNMTFLSPTSDRNPVLQAQREIGRPCQWLSNNKLSLQLPRTFQIKSCNAKEETLSTYSTKQNFSVFSLHQCGKEWQSIQWQGVPQINGVLGNICPHSPPPASICMSQPCGKEFHWQIGKTLSTRSTLCINVYIPIQLQRVSQTNDMLGNISLLSPPPASLCTP